MTGAGPGSRFGRRAWVAVLFAVALPGCGRYADFTLPALAGGDPNMVLAFEQNAEPVIARGDARDVLNPSVIRSGAAADMFYSQFDGRTWHTAHARSDDGLNWVKLGIVLSPDPRTWEGSYIAANGSALNYRGEVWYWYEAGPRDGFHIGLARNWRREPKPVLGPGPYQSWDEIVVADPYVIRIDSYFYLYYLGQDRARRQRMGVARSRDGITWQKLRTNPILEPGDIGSFDERGIGEPAVWSAHGFYWMLYTGRDTVENRRMGLARSTDGVHWRKLPAIFAGTAPWDAKVICDAEVTDGGTRVYFGGGDVARPDENLNGQIGIGSLRPVSASLGK